LLARLEEVPASEDSRHPRRGRSLEHAGPHVRGLRGLLFELPPLLAEPRAGEVDGCEVFEKLRGLTRIPRPGSGREDALDRWRKPEVGVGADHGEEAEAAELVPAAVLAREVDAKEAAR